MKLESMIHRLIVMITSSLVLMNFTVSSLMMSINDSVRRVSGCILVLITMNYLIDGNDVNEDDPLLSMTY